MFGYIFVKQMTTHVNMCAMMVLITRLDGRRLGPQGQAASNPDAVMLCVVLCWPRSICDIFVLSQFVLYPLCRNLVGLAPKCAEEALGSLITCHQCAAMPLMR